MQVQIHVEHTRPFPLTRLDGLNGRVSEACVVDIYFEGRVRVRSTEDGVVVVGVRKERACEACESVGRKAFDGNEDDGDSDASALPRVPFLLQPVNRWESRDLIPISGT